MFMARKALHVICIIEKWEGGLTIHLRVADTRGPGGEGVRGERHCFPNTARTKYIVHTYASLI